MDYVVAGFGIGAILALIGFALWELFGESEEPGQGWIRHAAIGLMIGSLVIWAITGVSLVSTIDDSTGSHLVLLTTLVTVVAILAGTFWYWRADQALVASLPAQQRTQKLKTQKDVPPAPVAAAAAPVGSSEVELGEWDRWPERTALAAAPAAAKETSDAVPTAGVSFEPEVAAESVAAAVPDLPAALPLSGEATVAAQEGADPLATPIEAETDVVAEKIDDTGEIVAGVVITDRVDTIEPLDSVNSDVENAAVEQPVIDLPANVHPIRPLASAGMPATEAVAIDGENDAKIVRLPDIEAVVAAEEVIVAEGTIELDEPLDSASNGVVESLAPVAFESSILADIDVSKAETAARYQSPILADLEKNPDELDGVGLARWRPEARLTSENEDEPPAPKVRRRQ